MRAACALAAVLAALVAAQDAAAHGLPGPDVWKPLKRGSRGHAVEHVQEALRIREDGAFGRRTVKAVKRFQKRNGLEVDGIVGVETATALDLLDGVRRTSAAWDEGPYPPPTEEEEATLERIAECESAGDPTVVSTSGKYRGKYQFHVETWERLGGAGDPSEASEEEQDYRALLLLRQSGTGVWGRCA